MLLGKKKKFTTKVDLKIAKHSFLNSKIKPKRFINQNVTIMMIQIQSKLYFITSGTKKLLLVGRQFWVTECDPN